MIQLPVSVWAKLIAGMHFSVLLLRVSDQVWNKIRVES